MVSGTISTESGTQEIHWIRRETHQVLVKVKKNEEDKPKVDLVEGSNRILNKLTKHIDRQVKMVDSLVKRKVSKPTIKG